MAQNIIRQWFSDNKKGLIIGFIFGSIVAPFLAVLGLGISLFEILRSFLIAPMDLIGNLIPNVQTRPNSYYVPIHKWILTLGFNGIFYAFFGAIIQSIIKKKS